MCFLYHIFGWDRVSFLCGGSHNVLFWIFDENNTANMPMFLVDAEQCLHGAEDSSASCAALLAGRLGVHQRLGGDTDSTAGSG